MNYLVTITLIAPLCPDWMCKDIKLSERPKKDGISYVRKATFFLGLALNVKMRIQEIEVKSELQDITCKHPIDLVSPDALTFLNDNFSETEI